MRAVVQRVSEARVSVSGQVVGQIGAGLVILVCAMPDDTAETARALAAKIAKMRILADPDGKMNLSLLQTGGGALVVSQFTLAADTRRGNRPGFSAAAPPDLGRALYREFAAALRALGMPTETGRFGADMQVSLTNDGPITIWLDSDG
ncbi:D-aminoacyl-tRNA deacylase [Actibacterium ureilyticum]|uniref:D-aminoacyl-tRNA deacylase n=1 Tax=Actibacterium ureilyticum TaxID=1590614 RepID=UPI000BAB1542|nr:D-aminoacyl-tRNA deacylase [Actibacterium ureilyticum]